MRLALSIIPLAIVFTACTDPDRAPTAAVSSLPTVGGARAAKPVANARATFFYHTVAPSTAGGRLIGDWRDADGLFPADTSIYDDGLCGVSAQIFISGSGDATMDPTGGTPCSPPRTLTVEFGDSLTAGSLGLTEATGSFFTNVRDVRSITTVDSWGDRRFRLMLRGFPQCDYLRYEDWEGLDGTPYTSDDVSFQGIKGKSIRVTLISVDEAGKRRWEAKSQANPDGQHAAFCEKVTKRGSVYLGAYDIPFRLEVLEK